LPTPEFENLRAYFDETVDRFRSVSTLRDRRELMVVIDEIIREAQRQIAEHACEIEKLNTEIRNMQSNDTRM
jgi:hypothetical protein